MLSAPSSSSNASGNSSTQGLSSDGFAPPTCEVRFIEVAPVPYLEPAKGQSSIEVEAHFKGDSAGCPALTWSTSPSAKLVVNEKLPMRATVYDPGDKAGIVDVSATLEPYKVVGTARLYFPR